MNNLGEALAGGEVLLGPVGVAYARRALEVAVDVQRRNGLPPPPGLRELAELLAAASERASTVAGSVAGTPEPLADPSSASSLVFGLADVAEVVQVTGWSDSYARRACRRGRFETARQVGGRWLVDRAELQAWRADRQEARSA